jgi:hypothetical protein
VRLGGSCDDVITRWVNQAVVSVVVAERLFRCAAAIHPWSAFRNSMDIVAP